MFGRLWHWMKAEDSRAEGDPRAPWRLFWVALAIRVGYMTLAHTYRIRPFGDHFQFAWEAGRIARSLVTGHGYSNPFAPGSFLGPTGPTAWLPPVYPLLIAGAFKLFGVYTPAAAWFLLAINCTFSAATALAVWEIAYRCFPRANAIWSSWLWVLYPAAMQYAVRWLWEMSLTTFLFTWIIVLALRMRGINVGAAAPQAEDKAPQTRQWLLFGMLWGIIALCTSTLLLFLPVCGLWILIGTWHRRYALRNAILAGIVFLACLTPWELRNYHAFHAFIPLRGNLGVETYLGNGPGAVGFVMTYDHPNFAVDQFQLYQQMGELRYARMRGELARAWMRAHPGQFIANTLKRIYFFWVSVPSDAPWALELPRVLNYSFISLAGLMGLALALRNRVPATGLFAWAFLLLPLPYYTVFVQARFRHPLEPIITILGVYLFQSATPRSAGARIT